MKNFVVRISFFICLFISVCVFSQEFNFDYLLTYSSQYGKSKKRETISFLDSSNPHARLIIEKKKGQSETASITDENYIHIFGVSYDDAGEIRLNYSNSVPLLDSGIMERTAEVVEEEIAAQKVKVTVKFYLEEKKRKPRITYNFIMKKFNYDLATAFLPNIFDSRNRARITKFTQNYIIESVWSQHADFERTTNTLERILKIKNPVKIRIEKINIIPKKN